MFLDASATAEKAARLIREAASNDAKLVVFPEVFIPGYPYWNWTMTPVQGSAWFEKYYKASILVPGPEIQIVQDAARENGCIVVIGVNERDPFSMGTMYNTRKNSAFSGIFGPDGRLISEPLIDVEGITYAQIDLAKCIQPKQMHDITGHYNRFDIFQLHVDRTPRNRVNFDEAQEQHPTEPTQA